MAAKWNSSKEAFKERVTTLIGKLISQDCKRFKLTVSKEAVREQAEAIATANQGIIDKYWRDGNPSMQADEMCENAITYPIRPTLCDWAMK